MKRSGVRAGAVELALVVALLALGTALRCWRLDLGWFGVDQARDVQTALDIAAGQAWPTVGPTMRRVTSLGALYYYFWALPHLVSHDPLATFGFAAALGVLALVLTWGFARRFWGPRAGVVALAVLATSRIAVIDGRVAWSPAALPMFAALLLWLLVGRPTSGRLALLGATLGLAVQLHLAMVAWVAVAVVVVAWRRPGWPPLAAGVGAGFAAGMPALYAALTNAGRDAGIASLPSRGPFPDVLGRVEAALALGWRVPTAFWQWADAPEAWPLVARAATMLISAAAVLGLTRLAGALLHRRRAPAVVLVAMVCQVGTVVLLPGEAWYYYLDPVLPLWALAVGALVAPAGAGGERLRAFCAVMVVAAALLLGVQGARFLVESAEHGYVMVRPGPLTLDGAGGRDAAVPGRLVTAGVKRAVATALATTPASFATRWLATHGPAFDDVTGDNGFWLSQASSVASSSQPLHAALWYRDDPTAPRVPTSGFDLVEVGPLVVARYRPAVAYDACRDERGAVAVPVRIVPDPRRYGDGTIARPPALPARITCAIMAGAGATRVVAAVSTGSVTLRDAAGLGAPAGQTSSLCIRRGTEPVPFTIEITLPAGAASDLDLYERPDPECVADKIAP